MKRAAFPLLVTALLVWSVCNFIVFFRQAMTLDQLEKQETLIKRDAEILENYRNVKIAPDYPPELTAILADYQSERAAEVVRQRAETIDCILVTHPVELEGLVLHEITEKLVLTIDLPKNHPSHYYEVGHRIVPNPFLSDTREVRRFVIPRRNGEGYRSVVNHRVRGFYDLPEEFVLAELRKIAEEIQAKGEKP